MEHNELKHKKEHIKLSLLMSLNKVQLISVGGGEAEQASSNHLYHPL